MLVRDILATAQHSTAQHSTAQHSTAQHSTAQTQHTANCALLSYPEFNKGYNARYHDITMVTGVFAL